MIKYLHYILKTMFKKWSIRISLVVGIFISTIIIRTAIKFGGELGATLTSINQMILIFPYMFITIFTVFATTHAFKDGEIDGSELLIISKPIRRNKIVLAKFVAVISAIIIYHAIFAIPLFWVASQAHVSDDGSKLLFVLSFVIGSSIIQLLMLGVITMLATILGKTGTLVISIVITVFFPMLSFFTGNFSHKTFSHENDLDKYSLSRIQSLEDDKSQYATLEEYDDFKVEVHDKDKYINIAYLDPWFQWSKLFTLFSPTENEFYVGEKTSINFAPENIYEVAFQNSTQKFGAVSIKYKGSEPVKQSSQKEIESAVESVYNEVYNTLTNDEIHFEDLRTKLRDKIDDEHSSYVDVVPAIVAFKNYYNAKSKNNLNITSPNSAPNSAPNQQYLYNENLLNYGITLDTSYKSLLDVYEAKPYGNKQLSFISWTLISIILLGVSGLIYIKRDFK